MRKDKFEVGQEVFVLHGGLPAKAIIVEILEDSFLRIKRKVSWKNQTELQYTGDVFVDMEGLKVGILHFIDTLSVCLNKINRAGDFWEDEI